MADRRVFIFVGITILGLLAAGGAFMLVVSFFKPSISTPFTQEGQTTRKENILKGEIIKDASIGAYITELRNKEKTETFADFDVVISYSPDRGGLVETDHSGRYIFHACEKGLVDQKRECTQKIEPFLILLDHSQRGADRPPPYVQKGDKVVFVQDWAVVVGDPRIVFYDHSDRHQKQWYNFEGWEGTRKIPVKGRPSSVVLEYPYVFSIAERCTLCQNREEESEIFIYNVVTGEQNIITGKDLWGDEERPVSFNRIFVKDGVLYWTQSDARGDKECGYKMELNLNF